MNKNTATLQDFLSPSVMDIFLDEILEGIYSVIKRYRQYINSCYYTTALNCPQFIASLQTTIFHSGLEKPQVLMQEVLPVFQTLMLQDSCKYMYLA